MPCCRGSHGAFRQHGVEPHVRRSRRPHPRLLGFTRVQPSNTRQCAARNLPTPSGESDFRYQVIENMWWHPRQFIAYGTNIQPWPTPIARGGLRNTWGDQNDALYYPPATGVPGDGRVSELWLGPVNSCALLTTVYGANTIPGEKRIACWGKSGDGRLPGLRHISTYEIPSVPGFHDGRDPIGGPIQGNLL